MELNFHICLWSGLMEGEGGVKMTLWRIVYFLYLLRVAKGQMKYRLFLHISCARLFLQFPPNLKPRSGGPRRPRGYHLDKLSRINILNSKNYHLNHFVARSHNFLQILAEVILLIKSDEPQPLI